MKKFEEILKNNGSYTFAQVAAEFGILQTRDQFIPGRFYSLKITSPVPDLNERIVEAINDGRPYFDLNPVGLSLFHENWKSFALMLNLRVMPTGAAAKLLEAYYAFSSRNGMDRLFKEGKLVSLDERRLIDLPFYMVTGTILSQILSISNLNYAINKYNIENIAEARLIDWDNFGMMVRPNFSQVGLFPENLNVGQVFEEFIEKSIE